MDCGVPAAREPKEGMDETENEWKQKLGFARMNS